MRKDKEVKENGAKKNLILGVVLLFLTAFLVSSAVRQIRTGYHWLSAAVSICGVILFGTTGVCLLVNEIRQRRKNKK